MYTDHVNCRACGFGPPLNARYFKSGDSKEKLVEVLDLGVQPPPNAFKREGEPKPGHYPVKLLACPRCGLGQLSAVVDPEVLYSNYAYVTSTSQTMREHFDHLFSLVNFFQPIHSMVEIGSNDGSLLAHFQKIGVKEVHGVDPARNLAAIAREKGIPTAPEAFSQWMADYLKEKMTSIDLVMARHVFCHIDNWKAFMFHLERLSSPSTLVCLEMPWAHDTIVNNEWDQVYLEHLSYLMVRSLVARLAGTEFHIHHVVHFPIHGGTLAILLRRNGCMEAPNPSVAEFLAEEKSGIDDWISFGLRAKDNITNMKLLVHRLRSEGKTVVGFGASAKATVWLNACGFNRHDIAGVYDCTPQKQYSTVPGTDIPVIPEGAFWADNPNYAICWAWNYFPEIQRKHEKWLSGGGRFILPVPDVKIV